MRLVTGVGSTVHSQGAALDERLVAGGVITCIGTLVCMDSIVSLEVRLAVEALQSKEWISNEWCW